MTDNVENPNTKKAWDTLIKVQGDEFTYEINRDAATIARDGLGVGFSEEALQVLLGHLAAFIGTRIVHFQWDHDDVMPQRMTVRIKVALDTGDTDFDESLEGETLIERVVVNKDDQT